MKQGVHEMEEKEIKEGLSLLKKIVRQNYSILSKKNLKNNYDKSLKEIYIEFEKEMFERFEKDYRSILSDYRSLNSGKIDKNDLVNWYILREEFIWLLKRLAKTQYIDKDKARSDYLRIYSDCKKLHKGEIKSYDLVDWYHEQEKFKNIPIPQRELAEARDKMEYTNKLGDTADFIKKRAELRGRIKKDFLLAFTQAFNFKSKNLNEEISLIELSEIFYHIEKPYILSTFEEKDSKVRFVRNYVGDVIINRIEKRDIYFFKSLLKMIEKLSKGLRDSKIRYFETLGSNEDDYGKILKEKAPAIPKTEYGKGKPALSAQKNPKYEATRKANYRIRKSRKQ